MNSSRWLYNTFELPTYSYQLSSISIRLLALLNFSGKKFIIFIKKIDVEVCQY